AGPCPIGRPRSARRAGRRYSSNTCFRTRRGRLPSRAWRKSAMSMTIWARRGACCPMRRCAGGWDSSLTPFDGGARAHPLSRLIGAEPEEAPAIASGFMLFFLLFASYFMLRPVRETFAIAGGVDNIQWLWTGTFTATLLVVPLYGWVASRQPRRRLLP